jgi:hypothetical protein
MKKVIAVSSFVAIFAISIIFSGCMPTDYQLSSSVVPAGGGSISPSNGIFRRGNNITLVATPSQYYKFDGWAGDTSGTTNPLTVNMNSNKNIVASFKKKIGNLNIKTNPSASGKVQPIAGPFEQGTNVKLTAIPATGYRFGSWTEDLTGTSNPANILIDREKIDVTANFIEQPTLKIVCEPNNAGVIPSAAGLHDKGETILIKTVPNFPYYPKSWTGTDDDSAYPTKLTLNKDTTVIVLFARCDIKKETQTLGKAVSKDGNGRWGPISSESIQLNQFEWVEGEIIWQTPNLPNTPVHTYIQDPQGNSVMDFGSSKKNNFNFFAQTGGKYSIVFQNDSIWYADYNLTYTVWTK